MNINLQNKISFSERWQPLGDKLRDESLCCLAGLHYRLTAKRFLNRARNKKILFSPQVPLSRKFVMNKICRILGYQMTQDPEDRAEVCIHWEAGTFRNPAGGTFAERPVINSRCLDISKRKVDDIFKKIFGYSIMIDPVKFKGDCVKKSDLNYRHDGVILHCPIAKPEEGFVYQRLVDNNVGGGMISDIRLPIFRDTIPFAYLKYRPVSRRFEYRNSRVEIAKINDVVSTQEQMKILRFFNDIGLDCGEIDIIRDQDTAALYIIDAEPITFGPPVNITARDYMTSLITMTECFESKFLRDQRAPKGTG